MEKELEYSLVPQDHRLQGIPGQTEKLLAIRCVRRLARDNADATMLLLALGLLGVVDG